MEQKKVTKAQLEKRINNAVVFVEKTKETQSIYFSDKGLRLTVTDDYAVIETTWHRHVFFKITNDGYSRPYIYTKRLVSIALEHEKEFIVKDEKGNSSYSYTKFFKVLEKQEDKTQFNVCWYVDLWFYNMFAPLYEIDETEAGAFLVYERYMHNIARTSFLLDEHKEDVTNKRFVNEIMEKEKEFLNDMQESVVLKAKSDEQRLAEEIDAIQKTEFDNATEGQDNE